MNQGCRWGQAWLLLLLLLSQCQKVDTATQYSGQYGAHSYTCNQSFNKVLASVRGRHPFHNVFARGAHETAEAVARWVRRVVHADTDDLPLLFAYYANILDLGTPCNESRSPPYVTEGGGAGLCNMLEQQAGTREKRMGSYFVDALDLHGVHAEDTWREVKNSVKRFGYAGYKRFVAGCNASCGPHCVYNPEGRCQDIATLAALNAIGAETFYGVSGGGGSGTGFEVFCVDAAGNETTLVTGGGGGGGGVSSPEQCVPVSAGGGGGGGVQIGASGTPRVGAGAGNHPPGWVDVQPDVCASSFAAEMPAVAVAMRACHASPHTRLVLRGGGGGGGGFEAYKPFDLLQCQADQEEKEPHAMSFGYGFQFALGKGSKLTPNAGRTEDAYVACPVANGACSHCVSAPDLLGPRRENKTWKDISDVFRCADKVSQRICARAHTADGRVYGRFLRYPECNCPLQRLFKQRYLPDTPQWDWERNGTCVYPPDPGQPTPPPGNQFPELTLQDLRDHPHWCARPLDCEPMPGC